MLLASDEGDYRSMTKMTMLMMTMLIKMTMMTLMTMLTMMTMLISLMTMLQTESSAWVQSANWFRYARGQEVEESMRAISHPWGNSDFDSLFFMRGISHDTDSVFDMTAVRELNFLVS